MWSEFHIYCQHPFSFPLFCQYLFIYLVCSYLFIYLLLFISLSSFSLSLSCFGDSQLSSFSFCISFYVCSCSSLLSVLSIWLLSFLFKIYFYLSVSLVCCPRYRYPILFYIFIFVSSFHATLFLYYFSFCFVCADLNLFYACFDFFLFFTMFSSFHVSLK
jgi:hypothetical protein